MSWKTSFIIIFFISLNGILHAQPFGYYNNIDGKKGDELKTELNRIISGHVDYSSSYAKQIINYSDADPDNPNNVILFYTQESRNASRYGIDGDYINREHVWAKSHGFFADVRPMDGDAFNLRPADASVNGDRSNLDFDNVYLDGNQHPEAKTCYYSSSAWEPGPLTKGQVARILFYMATRYEGLNDELDLEVVSGLNTYPHPKHGNLTALLEWNNAYPPSDFERRRNERIFGIQQNRNPFIDNPNLANLIWGDKEPSGFISNNFKMVPAFPFPGNEVQISVAIENGSSDPNAVMLYWGNEYDSQDNSIEMQKEQNQYSCTINLPNYDADERVYFKLKMHNPTDTLVQRANYLIPRSIAKDDLTSIKDIQGGGNISPVSGQTVTIAGRITSNFDGSCYIQDGFSSRQGVCVYGANATGNIGDSVVVSGTVTEFRNLTELTNIGYFYNFGNTVKIEPVSIDMADINEDYEGMLVEVKGVLFDDPGEYMQNGNNSYGFSKGTESSVIFARSDSRLIGHKIPSGNINLVGVVSQYQDNYQILARDMNDFSLYTSILSHTNNNIIGIYPNPAKDVLHISNTSNVQSLRVFDMNGRVLKEQNSANQKLSIHDLKEGFYILEIVKLTGENQFIKFVKRM